MLLISLRKRYNDQDNIAIIRIDVKNDGRGL